MSSKKHDSIFCWQLWITLWIVHKMRKSGWDKLCITCELCVNNSEKQLAQTVVQGSTTVFEGKKFVKINYEKYLCG